MYVCMYVYIYIYIHNSGRHLWPTFGEDKDAEQIQKELEDEEEAELQKTIWTKRRDRVKRALGEIYLLYNLLCNY